MSTTKDKNGTDLDSMSIEAIEAELKQFEIEERKRLGLPVENPKQWFDAVPREFTRDQRDHTTILAAIRKVAELLPSDEELRVEVETLTRQLREGTVCHP